MNSEERKQISIEDLQKVKDILGHKPESLSELKVIENQLLPDNVIVVSTKIFNSLK